MDPVAVLSLFSAITNIIIGIYVFLLNPKKITNRLFAILAVLITVFCIAEYSTRHSESAEMALFWGRLGYGILVFGSCLVAHFSTVFPRKYQNGKINFKSNNYLLISLYFVSIIVYSYFIVFSSIQDVKTSEWGYRLVLNDSTNLLIFWFLFCGLFAMGVFFHMYHKSNITTNEKEQIRLIGIGFLLVFIFTLGTNLVPPLFGISVFPMTLVSLTLFSFIVAYSMKKYSFMKLTTAETADAVVDTMVDSLIVVDQNENIVNVSKSTLNLLGYNKERLTGSSLKQVIKPSDLEKKEDILKRLLANDKLEDIEIELITKEGKSIPMNVSASTIRNKHGMLEGFVFVARDLTEAKIFIHQLEEAKTKLEDRVQERTAELEKSKQRIELQNIKLKKLDELRSNFLNITSHELRTPMASIKGYIQMLLKQILGDITEEQRRGLEVVLRNTNRLDGLIQDILDISRLESGTMKFVPEKTGIGKIVTESVETMQSAADLKNIRINADVKDRIPELVVDQERVKQVLINLIDNAIKFSPDGSVINVRTKRQGDDVLFEVQDFGRGIPKNKQKRIFETFYQVDSGMDRKFGGAGLGLSVSRGIILAHGGEIRVRSTLNKGSTFVFTLPIEPVQDIEGRFKEADIFRV